MHKYKILRYACGSEQVIQMREDGGQRPVSLRHPGYLEWLEAGNTPPVEEVTEAPGTSLEQTKAIKAVEIRDRANALMESLAAEYGPMERQTWDQQAKEAHAIQADPAASAPLVRGMAQARNMDVLELAARIIGHEAAWLTAGGMIIGRRQALQDMLDAASTVEQVQGIVVDYTIA